MFERAFDIPYFGLAPNGLLKPVVLLDFFQEIAQRLLKTIVQTK